ncbi:MAG: hypothetical protein M1815_004093 [Lichina confinis]|nr:MAG: hypothetical protein M1815_004093 [Lichina confinis]
MGFSAVGAQLITRGLGMNIWDLPEGERSLKSWMGFYTASMALHMVAMGAIKVTILVLYLRILAVRASVRIVIWIHLVAVVLTSIAAPMIYSLTCEQKTFIAPDGTECVSCVRRSSVALTAAAVNLFTDVTTLLIPLPLVWKLRLPKKTRMGVIGVLSTGVIVCIVSSVRLAGYIHHVRDVDASYTTFLVLLMGTIEMNTAIICSCLPSMPPLFRRRQSQHRSLAFFDRGHPEVAKVSKYGSHRASLLQIHGYARGQSDARASPSRNSSNVSSNAISGTGVNNNGDIVPQPRHVSAPVTFPVHHREGMKQLPPPPTSAYAPAPSVARSVSPASHHQQKQLPPLPPPSLPVPPIPVGAAPPPHPHPHPHPHPPPPSFSPAKPPVSGLYPDSPRAPFLDWPRAPPSPSQQSRYSQQSRRSGQSRRSVIMHHKRAKRGMRQPSIASSSSPTTTTAVPVVPVVTSSPHHGSSLYRPDNISRGTQPGSGGDTIVPPPQLQEESVVHRHRLRCVLLVRPCRTSSGGSWVSSSD